jgi:hypothetical protein
MRWCGILQKTKIYEKVLEYNTSSMTDKNKEVAPRSTPSTAKPNTFDQVQAIANYLQKAKQELGDCPAYQKLQKAVYEKASRFDHSTRDVESEFLLL